MIDDRLWAQEIYLKYISNSSFWVANAAISGIGDLVRIHKQIDKKIIKQLERVKNKRPDLSGKIDDTLDDIKTFNRY